MKVLEKPGELAHKPMKFANFTEQGIAQCKRKTTWKNHQRAGFL
jgi:hypothetical protein